jgi:hypothetical protein
MPDVSFQFFTLEKAIKLVSTPLSRLLIGKFSEKDRGTYKVDNFEDDGEYSGFLSLDQDKRIYPLLSSFQEDPESQALPVVGVWFYGLAGDNQFQSQFVYGHLIRFILSRNIQKMAQNFKKTDFVVISF